jgi:hypothetical protein
VSRAERTEAELLAVQEQLNDLAGVLSTSADGVSGRVDVTMVRATVQQQNELDERFGSGVVRLSGALWPID